MLPGLGLYKLPLDLTVITGFLNAMNEIKTVRLTFLGTPVTSIRQGLTVRLSISTDRPAPVRGQRQINLYIWYFVAVLNVQQ